MRIGHFFVLLIIFLQLLPVSYPACASTRDAQPEQRALLLYEATSRPGDPYPLLTALQEYLGHFPLKIERMERSEWHSGSLDPYQIVIYLGLKPARLPAALLSEMQQVPSLLWFEHNIEQYAAAACWTDFAARGPASQYIALNYRGTRLPFGPDITFYHTGPGKEARLLATVSNGKEEAAFSWQRGHLWYFARLELISAPALVLADLLHEICHGKHPANHRMLVRIEDIDPSAPPQQVQRITNLLQSRGIPCALAVIPARALTTGRIMTLEDATQLAQVLRQAQQAGAVIIQHGYSHQNRYSPQTGEGFEFWNGRQDHPLSADEELQARQNVLEGLNILLRCGLYPVGFEAPHYAISARGYTQLAKIYSHLFGQIQLSDETHTGTIAPPYVTRSPRAGMLLYPENLGYVEAGKVGAHAEILEKARQLQVVRDSFACFFFHYYLPAEELARLLDGLQELGYRFADLRQSDFQVQGKDIKLVGRRGEITLQGRVAPRDNRLASYVRTNFRRLLFWLISLVSLVLFLFLLIFWRLRQNKALLYEESSPQTPSGTFQV